jgi:hypothetical protein
LDKSIDVAMFIVYAYLMYRQNKILEETNRLMLDNAAEIKMPPRSYGRYWPMIAMSGLTLLTWIAIGVGPKINGIDEGPAITKFDPRSSEHMSYIAHRNYFNERVPLDNIHYDFCDFTNVTFVYNGLGPVSLTNNTIQNSYTISTDNDVVATTEAMLEGLNYLKPNVRLSGPNRTAVPNVEPLRTK